MLWSYGLPLCFIVFGLIALAGSGGAFAVVVSKGSRIPVTMSTSDRPLFGSLLLALGYFLLRWGFRESGLPRSAAAEARIILGLAAAGCIAYWVGHLIPLSL